MSASDHGIVGILGSSRSDGHTGTLVGLVFDQLRNAALFDLNAHAIGYYSYDNEHEGDDFLALAQAMARAKTIVFASPIYWYSMSAQMKAFFDRMTDMTDIHKPLGKALAGKSAYLISTGSSVSAPDSFTRPFTDTADYFKMKWGGVLYAHGRDVCGPQARRAADVFAMKIAENARTTAHRALAP